MSALYGESHPSQPSLGHARARRVVLVGHGDRAGAVGGWRYSDDPSGWFGEDLLALLFEGLEAPGVEGRADGPLGAPYFETSSGLRLVAIPTLSATNASLAMSSTCSSMRSAAAAFSASPTVRTSRVREGWSNSQRRRSHGPSFARAMARCSTRAPIAHSRTTRSWCALRATRPTPRLCWSMQPSGRMWSPPTPLSCILP